jgi:hypothetical protein
VSSAEELAALAVGLLQEAAELASTKSLAQILWAEYEQMLEAKREAEAFTGFSGIEVQ